MANILLIGGSRFIGKHLLHKLAAIPDNKILVLNRGNIPNADYLPSGVDHIALDRNDQDAMAQALQGMNFDLVFDICAGTAEHCEILLNSLESAPTRHIHVSTGSVYDIYGEDPPVYSLPVDEDFPIGRIHEDEHPYMNGKRGAEKVLMEANKDAGYPVVMVRPTFVYGPDNYIYREAYFFDRISQDRPIILPNSGNGFFDMVYVDDLADLMILVSQLPADQVVGRAFNGTKGDVITGNMYAKVVGNITGKTPDVLYVDPAEILAMGWPETDFFYPYIPEGGMFQDARRIEQELQFTSQLHYAEGLKQAYAWWSEHGKRQDDFDRENLLIDYIRAKGTEDEDAAKQALQGYLQDAAQAS